MPQRRTGALARCFLLLHTHAQCSGRVASARRPVGRLTFGSPHKLAKLNADVLDLWCSLLRALPSARLLVAYHLLSEEARLYFHRQFTERGIGADRVEVRRVVANEHGYTDLYHEIDVVLDSFPWSGHTTTCETLWMGVPVLTLRGQRHATRMAASILTQVGLTEMIAATPEEYQARAVQLAGDLDRLAELRQVCGTGCELPRCATARPLRAVWKRPIVTCGGAGARLAFSREPMPASRCGWEFRS